MRTITPSTQAIAERRVLVHNLYIKGATQAEIAVQVGVSQAVISRDLKAVRKLWQERAVESVSAYKAEELAKIDALEATYWQAWEESRKDKESITQQKTGEIKDAETGAVVGTRIHETKRREKQTGNPAFLDGVMACIDKRCKILGLDAPNRNLNIDLTEMSDAQLEKLAAGADIIDVLAVAEVAA